MATTETLQALLKRFAAATSAQNMFPRFVIYQDGSCELCTGLFNGVEVLSFGSVDEMVAQLETVLYQASAL
jgi:hypothetical protein